MSHEVAFLNKRFTGAATLPRELLRRQIVRRTQTFRAFVARLAARQVGSFIAPGLALDGFSSPPPPRHMQTITMMANCSLAWACGVAGAATDAKLVAHSSRSQRKLCIKVSSPHTKPSSVARAPATPLTLFHNSCCFAKARCYFERAQKCRELFVDSFHENL